MTKTEMLAKLNDAACAVSRGDGGATLHRAIHELEADIAADELTLGGGDTVNAPAEEPVIVTDPEGAETATTLGEALAAEDKPAAPKAGKKK